MTNKMVQLGSLTTAEWLQWRAAALQQAMQQQSLITAYQQQLNSAYGGYNGLGQAASSLYGYPLASAYFGTRAELAVAQREAQRKAHNAIPSAGISAGELIGYRAWFISDGLLGSLSANKIWIPGEPMTVERDDLERGLGVFCFRDPYRAKIYCTPSHRYVHGSVFLWGEIVEHENGFRAEFAAIRSLDSVGENSNHWFPKRAARRKLAELQATYGVTSVRAQADKLEAGT